MEDKAKKLLLNIKYPSDLKKIELKQLPQVCDELRQFIINELSCNPGHFGASLGTVELTVALHYVFDTPEDRILWDVGHQAYGHKILTGRKDTFHTNRKFKGISGFPNPKESEYDSFISGHASNSISAALGISVAQRMEDKESRQTIAVIGDGAMTGGLAFEGLNNAAFCKNNLIIVLNDNHMAIDPVVGGFSEYLVKLTTSQTYNRWRNKLYQWALKMRIIRESKKGNLIRFNNSLKAVLTSQHNIFEGLSIRYFGPVDGHDVLKLVKIFRDIKDFRGPKVIHIKTKKGKGFKPAEESATVWHAPGKFNIETGERIIQKSLDEPQLYQDVFGHTLVEFAKQNDKIVGVTPAMPTGCSMCFLMKEIPERAFDVGIAEAHAITFSAGLAKEGMLPFCNIYSSFMQRAYDQVIHDAALQNLDMVLCLDRGGLVGEDGATHHGAFDLAYLNCIPNVTISSPINEHDLRNLMYTGTQKGNGVFVIRYPRGKGELKEWRNTPKILPVGKGRKLKEGKDIAVLSIGPIGYIAKSAIEKAFEEKGVDTAHYDMIFLKPIDEEILHEVGKNYKYIITVENGTIRGGLGTTVSDFMIKNNYSPKIHKIGIPDKFIEHGSIPELYKLCGMDAESIKNAIINFSK